MNRVSLAAMLGCALSLTACAQQDRPADPASRSMSAPAIPGADMTTGEVRKIDREQQSITLKHGAIRNLDMPGMTMVFKMKDPAMFNVLKPGDKVKFAAAREGSALVVTEISVVK